MDNHELDKNQRHSHDTYEPVANQRSWFIGDKRVTEEEYNRFMKEHGND